MTTTHWTEQTMNDADLARAFLFRLPPAANALKATMAKEYAACAQDVEVFWSTLAEYMGSAEVARLRAS